jgi:hypothetical protein
VLLRRLRRLAQIDEALRGQLQMVVEHGLRVRRAPAPPDHADALAERRDQRFERAPHARRQPPVLLV